MILQHIPVMKSEVDDEGWAENAGAVLSLEKCNQTEHSASVHRRVCGSRGSFPRRSPVLSNSKDSLYRS